LVLIDSVVSDNSASTAGGIWVTGPEGTATLEGSVIESNHATSSGGGLWTSGKLVTILDSSFSGNTSNKSGGAIRVYTNGEIYVADSEISGNIAGEHGGGIASYGGRVLLERTTVSLNRAAVKGGAIENGSNSTMDVSESFITSNTAKYGGAIYNSLGTVRIDATTLHGNDAVTGGAIRTYKRGSGSYDVSLVNSTVTGNRASSQGGAIASRGSAVARLTHTTIVENSAYSGAAIYQDYGSTCEIERSVIDGSCVSSQDSAVNSAGYNAHAKLCRLHSAHGDRILTSNEMSLGELARNGGFAPTHLPEPDSLVLGVIPAAECLPNPRELQGPVRDDQRGALRDGPCDIGAVEVQPSDAVEASSVR
jgi:predicted outer membrane repeat protein